MSHPAIIPFNLGLLPADLPGWFGLPDGHPFGHIENMPIQFYLIQLAGKNILVDAPAYTFPDDGSLLDEFKGRTAAGLLTDYGVPPESITRVIITHPHIDHTLGLVSAADTPSFPNAQHYLSSKDWQALASMDDLHRHPLEVVEKAGLLTLVDGDLDLGDSLMILPAPGETPGHQIVWLNNEDGESYIVADLFHHPLEFAEESRHPLWADGPTMQASKLMLIERAAASGASVFFTHIEGAHRVTTSHGKTTWEKDDQ